MFYFIRTQSFYLAQIPVPDDSHDVQHDVGQGPERREEGEHLPDEVYHHVRSQLNSKQLFLSRLEVVWGRGEDSDLGVSWAGFRPLHDCSGRHQGGKSWHQKIPTSENWGFRITKIKYSSMCCVSIVSALGLFFLFLGYLVGLGLGLDKIPNELMSKRPHETISI